MTENGLQVKKDGVPRFFKNYKAEVLQSIAYKQRAIMDLKHRLGIVEEIAKDMSATLSRAKINPDDFTFYFDPSEIRIKAGDTKKAQKIANAICIKSKFFSKLQKMLKSYSDKDGAIYRYYWKHPEVDFEIEITPAPPIPGCVPQKHIQTWTSESWSCSLQK
jgi:hypothetical protein